MPDPKCTICKCSHRQSEMATIDGLPVHTYHHLEAETDEQWYNRVQNEITPKG